MSEFDPNDAVRVLDAYADMSPKNPCWLDGDDANAGLSYCRDCAEKAVAAGDGDSVDGGWDWQKSDGCVHCETCGALLGYVLTEYGVEEELDHFSQDKSITTPLSKDVAFHVARVLEAAPEDSRAIAVASKAVEIIKQQTT